MDAEQFRAHIGEGLFAQLREALAVGGDTHSPQDVIDRLRCGQAQMFQSPNAIAVTEITDHPQCRVLHVWLTIGDMGELFNVLLPQAEVFALANGCDRLTTCGRMGWSRACKSLGFDSTHIAMTKRLAPAKKENEAA